MKPFTINWKQGTPYNLDSSFRLIWGDAATLAVAVARLNLEIQTYQNDYSPFLILNQGLIIKTGITAEYFAWAFIAKGDVSQINPNDPDLSLQFQPDQVINLF